MTHSPESPARLSLELRADENVVVLDFLDFAGGRLAGRESRALHHALNDAIASLNVRLDGTRTRGHAITR